VGKTEEKGLTGPPTNDEIAARFEEMASLLELKGTEGYKLRAYHRAAQSVASHPEPLSELSRRGELQTVRGIGASFAAKVEEILKTRTCPLLERLRREIPPGILELVRIPGVGAKTAALVWRELGVADAAALEAAAKEGRLASLKGLGDKRAAAILAGIESLRRWEGRTPIARAMAVSETLLRELARHPAVVRAEAAGSLRRMRETVGDLDLLVATESPAEVLRFFASLPLVSEVIALGETKASVRVTAMGQVDVRAVRPPGYPAALLYFTGSKEHNVRLREIAKALGYKLNEYGLFREGETSPVAAAGEADIYAALGLPFVPPEVREDDGEVEAAIAGELPAFVELSDLKGDLHLHSLWSDGRDEIRALAEEAARAGLEYIAVTDHSRSLAFARGLTPERLMQQAVEIAALNREGLGTRILHGCEVEVLGDGTLDTPDAVLERLDFVIAAVHSPVRREAVDMTARLTRAAGHPLVDVIAHPTGRIIGQREPYPVDVGRLIEAAAASGCALELNASPHRLDLAPQYVRQAAAAGVKISVNTDAHDLRSLADLAVGVGAARRGWLTPRAALNAMSLDGLLKWRRERIGARGYRSASAGPPGEV